MSLSNGLKPNQIELSAGGHCVEVSVAITPGAGTLQLEYRGPDTENIATVVPSKVIYCDPVIPSCSEPAMDSCAIYKPVCSSSSGVMPPLVHVVTGEAAQSALLWPLGGPAPAPGPMEWGPAPAPGPGGGIYIGPGARFMSPDPRMNGFGAPSPGLMWAPAGALPGMAIPPMVPALAPPVAPAAIGFFAQPAQLAQAVEGLDADAMDTF